MMSQLLSNNPLQAAIYQHVLALASVHWRGSHEFKPGH